MAPDRTPGRPRAGSGPSASIRSRSLSWRRTARPPPECSANRMGGTGRSTTGRARRCSDKLLWPKGLRASCPGAGPWALRWWAGLCVRKMAPPEQPVDGLSQFPVAGAFGPSASYEHRVPAGPDPVGAHGLPQPASHFVPNYRVAYPLADHESKSAVVQAVGKETDDQKTVCRAAAVPVNLGEPRASGQAGPALHDRGRVVRPSTGGAP
jgi:hypothetical protein